jgi:hypothetical protein
LRQATNALLAAPVALAARFGALVRRSTLTRVGLALGLALPGPTSTMKKTFGGWRPATAMPPRGCTTAMRAQSIRLRSES